MVMAYFTDRSKVVFIGLGIKNNIYITTTSGMQSKVFVIGKLFLIKVALKLILYYNAMEHFNWRDLLLFIDNITLFAVDDDQRVIFLV